MSTISIKILPETNVIDKTEYKNQKVSFLPNEDKKSTVRRQKGSLEKGQVKRNQLQKNKGLGILNKLHYFHSSMLTHILHRQLFN